MPVELGYLTLMVGDIGQAERFYGALFAWEFVATPKGAHVKNTKLPLGLQAGGHADVSFLYFRVSDINAAVKLVVELGGAVRERTESPTGHIAVCVDDQTTVFSLWQPAPGFG